VRPRVFGLRGPRGCTFPIRESDHGRPVPIAALGPDRRRSLSPIRSGPAAPPQTTTPLGATSQSARSSWRLSASSRHDIGVLEGSGVGVSSNSTGSERTVRGADDWQDNGSEKPALSVSEGAFTSYSPTRCEAFSLALAGRDPPRRQQSRARLVADALSALLDHFWVLLSLSLSRAQPRRNVRLTGLAESHRDGHRADARSTPI
jgi:hypothetical protein